MPPVFSPPTVQDVPHLHRILWPDKPIEEVKELIERALVLKKHQRGCAFIVYHTQEISGFGMITIWSNVAEISDLIIRADVRSRGIGTALINELTDFAWQAGVTTLEIGAEITNPRALALYQRLGFVQHRTLQLEFQTGLSPVIYLRKKLAEHHYRSC